MKKDPLSLAVHAFAVLGTALWVYVLVVELSKPGAFWRLVNLVGSML